MGSQIFGIPFQEIELLFRPFYLFCLSAFSAFLMPTPYILPYNSYRYQSYHVLLKVGS